MRDGSPIGGASGGTALVLHFGEPERNLTLPRNADLTIQDISVDSNRVLRVRGEVTSTETIANVGVYVGTALLETRTFSQSRTAKYLSLSFEGHGTLDQIAGEKIIKVCCTDKTGHQTSKSRAVSLAPQNVTKAVNKLPQLEALAVAIMSHFDAEYYSREYPDVKLDRSQLVMHFIQRGWYEGRNPSAFFDTVSYILDNQDVAESGINPFFHYLSYGRREGRKVTPSISPSIRTLLLFGYELTNWVEQLRPIIDTDYYGRQLSGDKPSGIDLAAHFAYRGWREGKCPNPTFDVGKWVKKYPASARYLVNPAVVQREGERGTFNFDLLTEAVSPTASSQPVVEIKSTAAPSRSADTKGLPAEQHQLDIVQSEFSAIFYLAAYPDISKAGVDPLTHFFHTGWREGRRPNQDFDTRYYLEANEDVRDAGINPFWHYLINGRTEGRLARRPGGYRRDVIDAAVEPSTIAYGGGQPDEKILSPSQFAQLIKARLRGSRGLVVSLSHDCYVRHIGGTQIFIADEQRRFNDLNHTYIHLSPQGSRLLLLKDKEQEFSIRVVIDGQLIGLLEFSSLVDFIEARKEKLSSLFVVHCLLGFHVPDVIALFNALQPKGSVYWLHDYSSLCAGFNLLRNDVQFCGAPPPDSQACRICVYGKSRAFHQSEMHKLFAACNFEVASPSQCTLDIWKRSCSLPRARELVHPHWRLSRLEATKTNPRDSSAISIAFVGYPAPHKGWPIFQEIVRRVGGDSQYRFYHFAARGTPSLPGVRFITTEVTASDRTATSRLLADHSIDLLLLLSPWPETFSFVAYEAIEAGVDIICLADSGNVADLVTRFECGKVFGNEEEVLDFIRSGTARTYVNERASLAARYKIIKEIGTSVTIEGLVTEENTPCE